MCVNEDKILRMKDLIKALTEADIAYYRDDDPVMSDREYDQLTDELLKLEAETGLVISGSPTQKVSGEVLEELTSVRHTKPMLSAKKTKSIEEMVRFAGGRSVLVSWKLDGLTIVLRYENGELKQSITRGREGTVGEDVTHTVRTYLNVPLTIPIRDSIEVRGEGVISWRHFNLINSDLEDTYSHPRNLAAGSTRKLDANESRKRLLEFFAFDLVSDHLERPSKLAQMQLMQNAGFSVVPFTYVDSTGGEELLRKAVDSYKPEHYGYPVDGLIVEYDDRAYGASLGATGHHENRMIALKWKDDPVPTKFLGVDLATTRTGRVSITGLFEPVAIDGAMVSRAYLHNLDIFDAFQFGVGDEIMVYKANQIIPQIAENKTKSGTFKMPMVCPCCGEKLIVRTTPGGSRQMYCENPYCAAKLIRKFTHFCEKTRMNIEGLSQTTLSKFLGHGWIRNFGDLYELEKYRDEFLQTPGFGEKSFERLLASIEKSRHCTLARFIAGLGIPMVGRHAGRDLDRYFGGSWEAFEQAIKDGFDFTQLHDFGETMNNNIYIWYADAEEDKFRRLAEARVNKILHLYRLLGNLSWTGTYAYTKDQVDQIFTTLQAELLRVKLRFLRTQSTAKKRFVLSEPYTPERFKISEDNPTLAIPLPDGTYLRAVGYPTDTYPCIDIYWDNGVNAPTDALCFVEFNPDHEEDESVCIGAYRSNQDAPAYYAPYMAAERTTNNE